MLEIKSDEIIRFYLTVEILEHDTTPSLGCASRKLKRPTTAAGAGSRCINTTERTSRSDQTALPTAVLPGRTSPRPRISLPAGNPGGGWSATAQRQPWTNGYRRPSHLECGDGGSPRSFVDHVGQWAPFSCQWIGQVLDGCDTLPHESIG